MSSDTTEEVQQCYATGQPRDPIYEGDYSFNTGQLRQMGPLDYMFFAAVLIISTAIGFYHAWQHRGDMTFDIYTLGGRSMSAVPVSMSIFASYRSAVTLLGIPETIYFRSTMYLWGTIAYIFIAFFTATLYAPTFYQLGIVTSFEYLQYRFGARVRTLGASIYMAQMMLYMTFALYSPSVALSKVAGFELWGSVLSIGVCCIAYATFGGIKAVIWTDTFQIIVAFIGIIALLIQATITVGGLPTVFESLERSNRLEFADFGVEPSNNFNVWGFLIGFPLVVLSYFGSNEDTVHRISTCKDLKTAKWACYLIAPWSIFIHVTCCFLGMYMSAFYENCDPLKAGLIKGGSQMSTVFVLDLSADVPMTGLYVAILVCLSLSSFSSAINSVACVAVECLLKPRMQYYITDDRAKKYMMFLSVVIGLIVLQFSNLFTTMSRVFQLVIFLNCFLIPLLGLFSLGLFCPHINSIGATAGLVTSIIFSSTMAIVRLGRPPMRMVELCVSNCNITVLSNATREHLMKPYVEAAPVNFDDYNFFVTLSAWHGLTLDFLVCIFISFVVSAKTGFNNPKAIDPRLIVPVFDVLFPFYYLPERWREKLRFGIDHTDKWNLPRIQEPTRLSEESLIDYDEEEIAPDDEVADADDAKSQISEKSAVQSVQSKSVAGNSKRASSERSEHLSTTV